MAGTVGATRILHRSRGVVRTDVAITCDGSGVASATVVGVGFGRLVGVLYDGGLDASAVITISDTKGLSALVTYTTSTEGTPVFFRPSAIVTGAVGTAIASDGNNTNQNRDIFVSGKVSVAVASGGAAETAVLSLIVDEAGLGEPAITV